MASRYPRVHFALLFALSLLISIGDRFAAGEETTAAPELKVTEGFTIQRVTEPALVERPITMAFDEQGGLYVTDSSGSNDPLTQQLVDLPHRVLRLEDSDGDGRFDRRTVFADKMMFPAGSMWFRGSLYVAAPPSIWKLTDVDGDGVADRREEWHAGKTLTPCGNDLHGPYLGRDGWIYWCKGAFAEQTYDLPKRPGWKSKAAHIFRARLDGSDVEPVLTGGMDNPVDMVVTPTGERLLSSTFLHHRGNGLRDGIAHAIYGGVYGKSHAPIDGHTRTGDLMPVLTELGPAAASGLHYYESTALGEDVCGDLFCCSFNLHKVTRHELVAKGATYETVDSDFVTSESFDFHPTDVIEDADGSLLVCNTGGWYKLCCPTSQFHKPNVLGAIYRIRRDGAAAVKDPRGAAVAWDRATPAELVALLGDARPAVRERAIETLAGRGRESIGRLTQNLMAGTPVAKKLAVVWTLCRIDDPAARQVTVGALADVDPSVRQAAAHAAGLWRDLGALLPLCRCLADTSPAVVRAAAEAVGRIGDARAAEPLLAASRGVDDRVLEHSLIYALYEIGDAAAIRPGLADSDPEAHRVALMALSQLAPGDLSPADVLPLLTSDAAAVRDAAWWIAQRRPDWGEQIVQSLHGGLTRQNRTPEEDQRLSTALAQLAQNKAVQELIARSVDDASLSVETCSLALRVMAQSRVSPPPDIWIEALLRAAARPALRPEAVASLQSLGLSKPQRERARPALLELAGLADQPLELRLAALELLGDLIGDLPPAQFDFVAASLTDETPPLQRAVAAGVLGQANLTPEQKLQVAGMLARLAPLELTRLLPLFEKADEGAQRAALTALMKNDNPGGIRRDVLTTLLDKLPESLKPDGDALMAKVDALNAQRRQRLESLFASLPTGDVQRGHSIFGSKKAACLGCHAVAYVGGEVGPDLTLIGKIRTERDLLEAIIYPSASFVRSFEPLLVVTNDGQQFSGLLRQETPEEIVLVTGPQTSQRIPRDDVEEIRPSQTSLMPEGLEKLLSVEELADLIAYLKSRQ